MTTSHLLDPVVRAFVEAFPDMELSGEILPVFRESFSFEDLPDPADSGVLKKEIAVPGLKDGQPSVRCLLYSPKSSQGQTGGYLHFHGGGYVLGAPEMTEDDNVSLCAALGIPVLSVDYRLAPEHPVPAPIDDCYAALAWFHENAAELGIDPSRIAVGGDSAGAGLAAGLALFARETAKYPICFQLLTYPMIDDRTGSTSHPGDPLTGEFVWTRGSNQFGWSCYLGDAAPSAPHVPARADSLAGLPPAWIGTATLDLFRDENIDYAQRLMRAGVPTELVVYPGACHGFPIAADASVSKQYFRDRLEALQRALG